MGKIMINGEQYPSFVAKTGLDDSSIVKDKTWSSSKINEELEDVRSELDIIIEEANKNTSINDEVESLTTVWSSKKTSGEIATKKDAAKLLNNATDSTKWLKLKLGNSSTFQPIIISDQYGGKVEITGMADDGTYKPVKLVRHSYGDWTTYSAIDYTTTSAGDGNYKIRRFYYYPTDGYYYLEIRQWTTIKIEGNSTAELVTSLPDEVSAMTLIPESNWATKKDIDGTTIQTTTTTSEEYYAITYGDDYNDPANQNILIQYKRSNFSPSTYILSAVSYATDTRETVSVAKISNNFAGSTYNLRFYVDKDNKTVYLRMPSYSSVSLQNLAFKSKAVTYTKVDSIPDTATTLAVAEYASINDSSTGSTTSTWSSSMIASQINNATAIKYTNVIGANATKDTGWNLAQGESHFYGRLLQLDGHLGSKSSTFSFLLFVKANYDNPTTVYVTQLAGMDDDRSNIAHTTYFELGVSSSGNLTITNKSAVAASYRFI